MTSNVTGAASRIRSSRGTAAVEFAFALPMVFVLVVAGVRFGLALNQTIMLNEAVRAGVRQFTLSRGVPIVSGVEGPCRTPYNRVVAATTDFSTAPTITMQVDGVTVSPSNESDCLTKLEAAFENSATNTNLGSVKISATYSTTIRVIGITFCNSCSLLAQASGRIE